MQMPGKRPQHLVRLALGVHRPGQAGVEALDRRRDRPGAPLRPVPAQPRTLAQVLRDLLQLAQRLGLHRLDFLPVLQHPLQLALPAPQGPDRRRVLQPHAPLLEDFAGPAGWPTISLALSARATACIGSARRIQQQVRDVKRAQLVLEDGLSAFEGQCPVVHAPAQGISGIHPGDCDQCLLGSFS